jgi:hypothetical protein
MAENGGKFADAWDGLFGSLEYVAVMEQQPGITITVDWEDGRSEELSAADAWRMIFEGGKPWALSANGTIFRYDVKGIVPGLLERWYAERKEMQAKKKASTSPEEIAFWDKRQLVKKINLNSLYGAILNAGCRFFDQRIGQSTTLTGRIIAKHMDAHVNEAITGSYDHVGEAIIYGDTDSVYFTAWPTIKKEVEAGRVPWNKELCVELYDSIADSVNESFPAFMERACHIPREMGSIIKGGREMVATKGLFIKKKRYAVLVYDMEGKRVDVDGKPGKVKAMGLDLKRADTPKDVQEFLSGILLDVLTGSGRDEIIQKVRDFKYAYAEKPAWEKGTPKRVNNLTTYNAKLEKSQKSEVDISEPADKVGPLTIPGHVRAAINWNVLKKMHGDNYSTTIVDGMKTIVCKLKPSPLGFTSVGYPIDQAHIPQWFKDLPFDDDLMETAIVVKKVENLLGVLKWNIEASTDTKSAFDDLFTFE